MVLAQPVADRAGRVLAPAGSRLDARLLLKFRSWAVAFVEVRSEAEGLSEDTLLEKRIDEVLSRTFKGTLADERMSVIREIAKAHLVAKRRVPS